MDNSFVCLQRDLLYNNLAGPEPNEIDEGDYNVFRFSSVLVGSRVENSKHAID